MKACLFFSFRFRGKNRYAKARIFENTFFFGGMGPTADEKKFYLRLRSRTPRLRRRTCPDQGTHCTLFCSIISCLEKYRAVTRSRASPFALRFAIQCDPPARPPFKLALDTRGQSGFSAVALQGAPTRPACFSHLLAPGAIGLLCAAASLLPPRLTGAMRTPWPWRNNRPQRQKGSLFPGQPDAPSG